MSGAALAAIIVRRRGFIALAWIIACVFLLPRARRIESALRVAARVDGSESAAVDEQLASRFQSRQDLRGFCCARGVERRIVQRRFQFLHLRFQRKNSGLHPFQFALFLETEFARAGSLGCRR